MKDIKTLIEGLEQGVNDISIDFVNDWYDVDSDEYIGDCITRYADGQVSIYYSDIIDFIANNSDEVNESVEEFGLPEPFDIYKLGQQAEFMHNERLLYDDISDIITLLGLHYLLDSVEDCDIDDSVIDYVIDDLADEVDSGDKLHAIKYAIDDYIEEHQEELGNE